MLKSFLLLLLLPVLLLAQRSDKLGKFACSEATFTRSSDVTPYDIADLFTTETPQFLRFANVVKITGSSGMIEAITIALDTSANSYFNLELFDDTSGITLPNDNDPLKLTWANFAHVVAVVEGWSPAQLDSADIAQNWSSYPVPFITKSKHLYGLLTIGSAYTPKALGNVRVTLWIRRN